MRTISGQCVSSKEISLSKAAKVLSKFVSADNGASHVIGAYLHRTSASFNELNQLHKELKSSHSHKKKHKRQRVESGKVVENSLRSFDTNHELRKQLIGCENGYEDNEKSTQTVVKLSEELNGSIGDPMGNVGESERHRKNKKKKHEVESRDDGDVRGERDDNGKLHSRAHNEIESGQEQGDVADGNAGMEEGKKHKKEKKKHKEGASKSSGNKGEVESLGGKNAKGQQLEQIEKKHCNGVEGENGGPVSSEEVKIEQRKKRKSELLEGRPEERSANLAKKRKKSIYEGDI